MMRRYTPEDDHFIVETNAAISAKEQARRLGRSYTSIKDRRSQLIRRGLLDITKRACSRPFTPDELILIRSEIGYTPTHIIARRIGRTMHAIVDRAGCDGLYPENIAKRADGLSTQDVYQYLGVDRKSIYVWVASGQLHGTKRLSAVREGSKRAVWTFSYDEVERFLRDGGALYKMRPVRGWRGIYEEARQALMARLIVRSDLIRLLHVTGGAIYHWQEREGFPQTARTGTQGAAYYDRSAVRTWLDAHPHYWTKAAREGI